MTALHAAVQRKDAAAVEAEIARGVDVNAINSIGSQTALHIAASAGASQIVSLLLRAGARVDTRNALESTPLHLAGEAGDEESLLYLIRGGANVNARDANQRTALHRSVKSGSCEVVQHLLAAGCDPTIVDEQHRTAYDAALLEQQQRIAQIIKEWKPLTTSRWQRY